MYQNAICLATLANYAMFAHILQLHNRSTSETASHYSGPQKTPSILFSPDVGWA